MKATAALLTVIAALAVPAGAAAAPTVYAASSLRAVLPALDGSATYSFGGSNALQFQIERGAPADVFASASWAEAQALFHEGLCSRPQTFATNILVMLVPAGDPAGLTSVYDLRRGKHLLAVGTAGVPVGGYTRQLLRRLRLSSVLTSNTVSDEKDVAGISAKVALGSADAGFVYHTDALVTRGRTREIRLPKWAQPAVRYQLCAVRRPGADGAAAEAFVRRLVGSEGRRALVRFGFGVPRRR